MSWRAGVCVSMKEGSGWTASCVFISVLSSLTCFLAVLSEQPALAPVRARENQWCSDKLAINPDICSTSSSTFYSTEHNNKTNKRQIRFTVDRRVLWGGGVGSSITESSLLVGLQAWALLRWRDVVLRWHKTECCFWFVHFLFSKNRSNIR